MECLLLVLLRLSQSFPLQSLYFRQSHLQPVLVLVN
jgi:hypothetical protein